MTDSGTAHLRAVDASPEDEEKAVFGVTPPSRKGGSSRFLTDVLIELGYCEANRVQSAIDEARASGVPPERLLLEQHAITPEQLSRAIAERYGLDHLDLGAFKVDMAAVNLLTASVAKRYGAVPVS
jgi:type IV pilus assembly protein PilB